MSSVGLKVDVKTHMSRTIGPPRRYVIPGRTYTLRSSEAREFGALSLQQVDDGRLLRFLQTLNLPWEGASVLDLGCGPGTWAIPLAALGVDCVTCHDASPTMLEFARSTHVERGVTSVRYVERDLTDLAYPNDSFDIVICCHALYYSSDEQYTVAEVARTLKPSGLFYIQSPSWKWIVRSYKGPPHKRLVAALAPVAPALFGRKLVPTAFSWFRNTSKYCRDAGLICDRRVNMQRDDIFAALYRKPTAASTPMTEA